MVVSNLFGFFRKGVFRTDPTKIGKSLLSVFREEA